MDALKTANDTLFILLGAIMVLAMHAGFAFLEVGTVRKKNQVNALVKILTDFAVSTIAYFFVGYGIAYGTSFFVGAEVLAEKNGFELTKFFFLLTFAAAIPAIISGGIAERAKFNPQLAATFLIVGFVYPFFEGIAWNQAFGIQAWLKATFGEEFHDFAGSVVVHAMGGWIALPAVLLLGARHGRYRKSGEISAHPPSSIPFLALGAWILTVGWFGFNVMSAQTLDKISGLVALNSLMAMVGGTLVALVLGKNDPGFVHNGPLAGLVAVCAGSDLMHPMGALVVGGVAGALFAFAKGTISPEAIAVGRSIDGLVMVLLGGVQALAGPVVGAAAFTWLQDAIIRSTDYWRAVLGLAILAVALAFPQGIAGALGPRVERLLERAR